MIGKNEELVVCGIVPADEMKTLHRVYEVEGYPLKQKKLITKEEYDQKREGILDVM